MRILLVAALAIPMITPAANAQPVRAVRPLDGYVCMKLAVSEAQVLDPKGTGINLLAGPTANAPLVTTAPATVFVRAPEVRQNGFLEVLALNGKPAWIAADKVRPLDSLSRCIPSVMSNGRLGIG